VPITVRISIKERCTTLCDKVVSDLLTYDRSMVFSGSSGFLHQYIDCHDITEVLLKLALNTIKQTNQWFFYGWPNVKHMIKMVYWFPNDPPKSALLKHFIMDWKKKFFLLLSFFNYKMCLFGIFIERKKNCLPIHLKNCNIIIAMYRFDLLESGQNFRPNKISSSKC
jgi:hypothetical protein